jgi:lipopolysaccharide transport system ATP-binding protein
MSCDGVAIRVRDVSKHYFLYGRPQDRLKQSIVPRLQRLAGRQPAKYYRDFAALGGVSFEVKRGETVGIIGRNGSGKSTLLQIICGTLQPSSGSVEVNGRIAALLELGAGFNADYTGRENVYLNAAILGLARPEIDARFDAIAAFADIGAFIDQPVKTYSSGMYVRLAFATAINVDPDILVVDEALAVGDEAFQRKCYARIEEIQARGGTILFVSHAVQTIVQLCSRALLIEGGELLLQGRPKTVTNIYQRLVNLNGAAARALRTKIVLAAERSGQVDGMEFNASEMMGNAKENSIDRASGPLPLETLDTSLAASPIVVNDPCGATLRDIRIETDRGLAVNVLDNGRHYNLCYSADFGTEARNVGFGVGVRIASGVKIFGAATDLSPFHIVRHVPAGRTYHVRFRFECILTPGTYFVNAGIKGTVGDTRKFLHRLQDVLAFRVPASEASVSNGFVDAKIVPTLIAEDELH